MTSLFILHWLGMDNASGRVYLALSGFLGDVSIITSVTAMIRRSARQHREKLAQDARHHRERLRQASEHHEALKQHLSAALAVPAAQPRRRGGDRA